MPTLDWNPLAGDDVRTRFNAAEEAAYAGMSGNNGLDQVVADVVLDVRGKIKAGGKQRGPDGSIPNSLKASAISLCIWRWVTAFSKQPKLQTEERQANYREAMEEMTRIAKGEQAVELPDPGVTDTVSAPLNAIQVQSKTRHQFKRRQTEGL
jgi:hypothetical protein